MRYLISLLVFAVSLSSSAQTPPSLDQLKQLEQIQDLRDATKQLETQLDTMTRRRSADCIKAIGYAPFCSCVMKELPVAWSFGEYVAITTRNKEENGYEKLDADYRTAYDKVAPIRDKCVKLINQKP